MTARPPLPGWGVPEPPPPPPPPPPGSPAGGPGSGDAGIGPGLLAALVFLLAGLGPAALFVAAGTSEDETATGSATAEVLWLSAIALGAGAAGAAVAWGVARGGGGRLRTGALTVLLLLAGGWGVVTGFLGSVAISIARHPTWDDA